MDKTELISESRDLWGSLSGDIYELLCYVYMKCPASFYNGIVPLIWKQCNEQATDHHLDPGRTIVVTHLTLFDSRFSFNFAYFSSECL